MGPDPDKDASLALRPATSSNGPIKFEPPATRTGAPPTACFLGQIVTIEVGTAPAVKFFVHEALLCYYSAFFHNALNGRFKEAESKVISLPEDDPIEFAMAVHWLYSGEVDGKYYGSFETDTGQPTPDAEPADEESSGGSTDDGGDNDIKDTADKENNEFHGDGGWPADDDTDVRIFNLTSLWILGDKLQMPALQNAATKTLLSLATSMRYYPITAAQVFPSRELFKYIYEETLPTAPLRTLIVDMALVITRCEASICALVDDMAGVPEVAQDLAKRLAHFWLKGGAKPPDPYSWLRSSWQRYRVGGYEVVENDLFEGNWDGEYHPVPCVEPEDCNRGEWDKRCARCERVLQAVRAYDHPWVSPVSFD
ncbi:hypothetical protein SLS58_005466 [Diplodia intermedia]|uniref:BTB domain-containing protein n=1 Tax=Diplodia intermedia TaxID=856260 RepID=A0ABR3TQR0_9PEZI